MSGKGAVGAQTAKLAVALLLLGNLIRAGSNSGTLCPVCSRRLLGQALDEFGTTEGEKERLSGRTGERKAE